jgi:phosphonate degradation associated HDIG domain protein
MTTASRGTNASNQPPGPDPVAMILRLFRERGGSGYGGEAVTQEEHALQAAACAAADGAAEPLVAAALLHDIGHLLHDLPDDAPETGVDDHHENAGGRFLGGLFGPEVCEPVRLHVAAKRYLTAVEPDYLRQLSGPSLTSLALQGGPMTAAEQEAFRAHPHWEAAVQLRRYDEQAKVPGVPLPTVDTYAPQLRRLLRAD